MEETKGYVHVYTGNGKGKTTAAIGLMLRAAGAGRRIYFGQFIKDGDYSEIKVLKERFPEITIRQYGGGLILNKQSSANDKSLAREGLAQARDAVLSDLYDIIVLDEINVACFLELISVEEVMSLIELKPERTELILTGRYADKRIIEAADLVSDITMVKHYFADGVMARTGIEM